jgi:hypothetical protein
MESKIYVIRRGILELGKAFVRGMENNL